MPANPGGNRVKQDTDGALVRDEGPHLQSDRITVALIPQSADDLQNLQEKTGFSKTDVVNRALTLYDFIDSQLRAGQDLIIRNRKTGETQLVRFL